jgi:hypothetical protein
MIEKDWKDCFEKESVKKIYPDKAKAKSLIETSKGRIEYLNSDNKKDDKFLNFIFENYYSSILELLHALAILDEFNISNHICIGFYLKTILKREDLFRIFDDLRFKRNSILYYGKCMDRDTSKKAIEDSNVIIVELNKILTPRLSTAK